MKYIPSKSTCKPLITHCFHLAFERSQKISKQQILGSDDQLPFRFWAYDCQDLI